MSSFRRKLHRGKDVHEYELKAACQSPASSMSANSGELRPMDEISLLKKGFVDKEGHHNLRSGRPYYESTKPISLQELTTRGLVLDDGNIIYGVLNQENKCRELPPIPSDISKRIVLTKKSANSPVKKSSLSSIMSQKPFEPVINMTKYQVGVPEEKAYLVMGDTKHGKHYELVIDGEFHLILTDTDKMSSLNIFRDL